MPILGNVASQSGKIPGSPTITSVTPGDASASVAFNAPAYIGKGSVTYTVTSSPGGITNTGSSSPIVVSGLNNGTSYTFTITAGTNYGVSGVASSASDPVTPVVPLFDRAVAAGGQRTNVGLAYKGMEYITMSTTGNGTSFGNVTSVSSGSSDGDGFGSTTRGMIPIANNYGTGSVATVDYITLATTGNSTFFGNRTVAATNIASHSSATRGAIGNGYSYSAGVPLANIDYCTIATTGNFSSFGTSTYARSAGAGGGSSTRAIMMPGGSVGNGYGNTQTDYITIASTGNATVFGSRTEAGNGSAVVSNSTRLVAGGNRIDCCTFTTVMDYVTIASTGNFTYFGALQGNYAYSSATANATRGVWATWGRPGTSPSSTWDYITLASTGNAQTFGSAFTEASGPSTCGGAHGGLQ
jgi:hypothetical protein